MSLETAYKEEGDRVLEAAPLTVGAGAAELAGVKVEHP